MPVLQFCLQSLLALLVISFVSFGVIACMPSDPVHIALHVWNLPADEATIAMVRTKWGLDQPLLLRYLRWLTGFTLGDWGRSFRTGEPILAEFAARLPVSLFLGISGLALAFLLAIPLGFLSALWPDGLVDRFCVGLSVMMQSVPGFLLGLVLLWGLGVQLRWVRPFANDSSAFVLPVSIITLHTLAVFSRIYRHDMIEVTHQPYFRTALSKGLSRIRALASHTHARALYTLVSAVKAQAGQVIGGTAALEVLFNLPGISQFLVQSIEARDQMVLQAYVMVIAFWMMAVNALASIAMISLEPRTNS